MVDDIRVLLLVHGEFLGATVSTGVASWHMTCPRLASYNRVITKRAHMLATHPTHPTHSSIAIIGLALPLLLRRLDTGTHQDISNAQ